MSEDQASDSADKNIRILAAGFSLAFAFGAEEEFRKENWAWCSICVGLAIAFQFVFWLWSRIVPRLTPRIVVTARAVATDSKWWVSLVLCVLFLVGVSLAFSPPRAVTPQQDASSPPTAQRSSLRLQFNNQDASPEEISGENIADWTWVSPTEWSKVSCPFDFLHLQTNNSLASSNERPCYDQYQTWVFVLVFKKPVIFKTISLNAHGANLPKWELAGNSKNYAMIWFHGALPPMVLDLETSD